MVCADRDEDGIETGADWLSTQGGALRLYNLLTWLVVIVAVLAFVFVLNLPEFAWLTPSITAERGNPIIAPR